MEVLHQSLGGPGGGLQGMAMIERITTYLSSQITFGDVRNKFMQLQQISMLLNLNHVHPIFNSLFFVRCDSYVGYTCIELPVFQPDRPHPAVLICRARL